MTRTCRDEFNDQDNEGDDDPCRSITETTPRPYG